MKINCKVCLMFLDLLSTAGLMFSPLCLFPSIYQFTIFLSNDSYFFSIYLFIIIFFFGCTYGTVIAKEKTEADVSSNF